MAGLEAFSDLVDYPMYIVTAAAGGERAGCLVGFASQCSISPPRFAVWLSTANRTYRVARNADCLAVHLIPRDHADLARLFGGETGDETDKFQRVAWQPAHDGTPVLRDARPWFVGRVVGHVEGGDHAGFVLDVVEASPPVPGRLPLVMFSDVSGLSPGHPA